MFLGASTTFLRRGGRVVRYIFFFLISTSLNEPEKGCRYHPLRGTPIKLRLFPHIPHF